MNNIKQATWLFITLTLLACSGWYFAHSEPKYTLDKTTLSTTVDATAYKLVVRQFNEKGALINKLTAPKMEHIPKGNKHLFDNPFILVVEDDKPAWDIKAQRAVSFEGGARIKFQNNVIVHQSPGDKTQESTLKTEEVTYFPKLKKATSDVLVTFEQTGNLVQSIGMNAYLDEKRVELLHKARGLYVPTKG